MLIVFGNQKGGAGKSTLAILFANWLTSIKKKEVLLIDLDFQKTIDTIYKESEVFDGESLYQVISKDLEEYSEISEVIKKTDSFIILDLPGKLDDTNLIPVLEDADAFIIPFGYDKMTYNSTTLFYLVAQNYNKTAPKFFIPNKVQSNVKYDTLAQVNEELSKYGSVTPPLSLKVDFQRINTKSISNSLLVNVEPVFELILKNL